MSDRFEPTLMAFLDANNIEHAPALVPVWLRMRALALAKDAIEAARFVALAHGEWAETGTRDAARIRASFDPACWERGILPSEDDSAAFKRSVLLTSRLAFAFKTALYAVRAYQDIVYITLRHSLGQPVGKGSLGDAKKTGNPVGDLLRAEWPEGSGHFSWFESWRDRRNGTKDGVNFAVMGDPGDDDIGVSANRVNDDGGVTVSNQPHAVIRLSHVEEAIEMSTALAWFVGSRFTREKALASGHSGAPAGRPGLYRPSSQAHQRHSQPPPPRLSR